MWEMENSGKTKKQLICELEEIRRRVVEFEGSATTDKRTKEDEKYMRDLAFLSRTSIGFLELSPEEDIYEFIGRQLRELVGNSIILVNSFEGATDNVCVRAVLGVGGKMGSAVRILGKHPVGMSLMIDDEARLGLGSGKLEKVPGGLYEFSFRRIPRTVCRAIEKLLDLGDIYAMGFVWKGELFGSASILTRKGTQLGEESLIETFIKLASVALQRRQVEQALQKAHDELEIRVEERTSQLAKINEQLRAEITERKQAEEALRESEEKYRTFFRTSRDCVFITSKDGRWIDFNDATVELLGYENSNELRKVRILELYEKPEERERITQAIEQQGFAKGLAVDFRKKDGSIINILITAVVDKDESGNVIGYQGTFTDITERKQIEEELRKSRAQLQTLLDSSPDVIRQVDRNLKIVWANKAALTRSPDAVGQPCYKAYALRDEPCEGCPTIKAMKTGQIETDVVYRPVAAGTQGESYWEAIGAPLKESDGTIIGAIQVLRNVTERKQAEEALRRTEQEKTAILDSMSELVVFQDMEHRLIWANRAAGESVDTPPAQLVGRYCYEVWHQRSEPCVGCPIAKAIETDQPQQGELTTPDGRMWSVRGYPVRDVNGDIIGIVESVLDITERKQAEEHAQFLANVLESSSQPFAVGYSDGRLRTFNTAYCELLGYSRGELHELKWDVELTPPEWREVVAKAAEEIIRTRQPQRFEKEYIRKDGSLVPVEVFTTPIFDSKGDLEYFFSFFTDITERRQAEEALRESEQRYRTTFEHTGTAMAIIEEDTTISLANHRFELLSGYSREEIEGKKRWTEFVHQEDLERMKQYHVKRREPGGEAVPTHYEFRFLDKEGNIKDIFLIVEVIPRTKKSITSLMDITERKRAEETLRGSEEKYRSLVSNVKLGVFRNTPEPVGRFLEVNPAMEKITGYRRKELLQMNVSDLYVHPEERERVLEEIASGKGKVAKELRFRKKDGTEIVVLSTKVVVRDDAGKILYFDGILEDITERKQAEARIVHLTNMLRALRSINQLIAHEKDKGRLIQQSCNILVEARGYSIAWMLLLDEDGNYISAAGSGAEKSFPILLEQMKRGEYPPCVREVLAQEPPFTACDDVKRQHIECVLADCFMGGGVGFVNQLEYEGRVYGIVCVSVSPEMAQDEEEHELFRELATDVAYALASAEGEEELKRVEEKLREAEAFKELDRLRSELVANISHELRTPLASIKGFATTLLQPDVKWSEEEQRDFLQSIDQETDRLTSLISDLLDMSRLDVGALKLEKGDYRISEILDSVSDRLASLTEHHQLEVIVPAELPAVFVDEMRIGQVITNMVENATKFSSKDSPITIEAQLAGDQIIISVTDRGQGIPPELLDRVFDRFYQTESVVTGRKSGTGLGLSICQGIMKAHGGRIWVESKLGEGSKFSLNLPVSQSEGQDG